MPRTRSTREKMAKKKEPTDFVNIKMNDGTTTLALAIEANNSIIARILLDHGANPNLGLKGVPALQCAIEQSEEGMVRILLDYGADPNLRNSDGLAPLVYAVKLNRPNIVKMLLDAGADRTNQGGETNFTALHMAVEKENVEIIKLLLG